MRSIKLALLCSLLSTNLIISPAAHAGYDDWQRQVNSPNQGIVIHATDIMVIYISQNFGEIIANYFNTIYNNNYFFRTTHPQLQYPQNLQFHLSMVYQEEAQQPQPLPPPPIWPAIIDRFGRLTPTPRDNMPNVYINQYADRERTHMAMGRLLNTNDTNNPIYYYYPEFNGADQWGWGYRPYRGAAAWFFNEADFERFMQGDRVEARTFDGREAGEQTLPMPSTAQEQADRIDAITMLKTAWYDANSIPPPSPVPPPPSLN
jgi:hypothetical protein